MLLLLTLNMQLPAGNSTNVELAVANLLFQYYSMLK